MPNNTTYLWYAIYYCNTEAIAILKNFGININESTYIPEHSFFIPACIDVLEKSISDDNASKILESLINFGANVNLPNLQNQNALHIATKLLNIDCIKQLINANCNTDLVDNDGYTPIMYVFERSNINSQLFSIIELFINSGANINIKNNKNEKFIDLFKDFIIKEQTKIIKKTNSNMESISDNIENILKRISSTM